MSTKVPPSPFPRHRRGGKASHFTRESLFLNILIQAPLAARLLHVMASVTAAAHQFNHGEMNEAFTDDVDSRAAFGPDAASTCGRHDPHAVHRSQRRKRRSILRQPVYGNH